MTATAVELPSMAAPALLSRGVPPALPRLLTDAPVSLDEHLDRHSVLPSAAPGALLDLIEASGLTGRGGAAFPVHRKWRAVAAGRGRAVVVGNGAEGEPASGKDKTLLATNPHPILDGLQVAARAVGAQRAYLYVHRDQRLLPLVRSAVEVRRRAGIDRVPVQLVAAPSRFIAGEESAVASRISGGDAVPRSKPPRVFERGVDGKPTLVQNIETLAHIGLLARYGADWFRSIGVTDQPGSMLFTVSGAVAAPGVVEAPVGATVEQLVEAAGGTIDAVQAVLLGGYHGTWVTVEDIWRLPLANNVLRPHGWSVGAGVVVLLPVQVCGLAETARVVRYLAGESAGQCGPCVFGLPALSAAIAELARPGGSAGDRREVERLSRLVERRGACHHPDGSVRFVRSAMTAFADELQLHVHGRCRATNRAPVLPTPQQDRVQWR